LRYSEKPEVNAFLAQFTTRCYNSLLVNEFWRSGPDRWLREQIANAA
jgi:hypothetical protein